MQNRGPFVLGKHPRDAVRTAVMVEDAARSAHLARTGGATSPLAGRAIDALFRQNPDAATRMGGAVRA